MANNIELTFDRRFVVDCCRDVGLVNGDEILVIDGQVVAELDRTYIESLLRDRRTLHITVRSCLPASDSHQHMSPTVVIPGMLVFTR